MRRVKAFQACDPSSSHGFDPAGGKPDGGHRPFPPPAQVPAARAYSRSVSSKFSAFGEAIRPQIGPLSPLAAPAPPALFATRDRRPHHAKSSRRTAGANPRLAGRRRRRVPPAAQRLGGKRRELAGELARQQRRYKIGLFRFLRRSSLLAVLTAPVIYLGWIPFMLMDLFVTLYQAVCFRSTAFPRCGAPTTWCSTAKTCPT
jgi:hypothetical protein